MKNRITIILLLLITSIAFGQEKLNNASIIELVEFGFESNIIKSKINSSQVEFDTSLKALKKLKDMGVPSDVLALMIDKSKIEIETGVFYYENETLKKIEPSVFSGTKSSALGAVLTYGIASAKIKSYIHNATSNNRIIPNELIFVFQFDSKSKSTDLGSGNWWFKTASSPNEFVLTKLKVRKNKNQRELITGKVSGIAASSQMGVDTKRTIPFTIKDLGNGRYEVKPNSLLESGEYCFFYQGTIPMGGFNNQSIFDFSIQ